MKDKPDKMPHCKSRGLADKKKGISAPIEFSIHDLAYIVKGLQCRIGVYERQLQKGETLTKDDEESYLFNKELRNRIKQHRDEALSE